MFFTARQHVVKNVIEVRNIVLEREFDFIQLWKELTEQRLSVDCCIILEESCGTTYIQVISYASYMRLLINFKRISVNEKKSQVNFNVNIIPV